VPLLAVDRLWFGSGLLRVSGFSLPPTAPLSLPDTLSISRSLNLSVTKTKKRRNNKQEQGEIGASRIRRRRKMRRKEEERFRSLWNILSLGLVERNKKKITNKKNKKEEVQ
jgi:hypothetical protein